MFYDKFFFVLCVFGYKTFWKNKTMSNSLKLNQLTIELVTKQNYKQVSQFMFDHLKKSKAISPCEYIFASNTLSFFKKKKKIEKYFTNLYCTFHLVKFIL